MNQKQATHHARIRADQLVCELGLTSSREQAKRLIMAGQVQLLPEEGSRALPVRVDKPGQLLRSGSRLALTGQEQYVSRGAYKLLTILESAALDVTGYVCLDAGASTGGFTDLLLQRGAARVYAVDVGHNQLHEKLRADSRVVSMEGVNLRTAGPDLIGEPVDMVVADVSFISLTLVLEPCMAWLRPGGWVAALVKPQFELGPGQTDRGVVRSEALRQQAVDKVVSFARDVLDLEALSVVPAAIKGPKGNQEYLALFRRKGG
ncbi:MAG: TlyA family RNA methyltransferase [Desulfovibrionaceae bacterium]|nr:TlyA family RNA methyltransferase [Desulfovibrionaceae bacterium]